jgi:hypothetical protein
MILLRELMVNHLRGSFLVAQRSCFDSAAKKIPSIGCRTLWDFGPIAINGSFIVALGTPAGLNRTR